MEALVAKAVERLGKKKLWLVVHALRRMDAADCTVAGARDALRRIRLYLDDDNFSEIAAQFVESDGATFDVAAFVRAILATLPPRRQYAVSLVVRKLDPDSTGFVSFETLREMYDVMRHPLALKRRDSSELVNEFIADFEEAHEEDGITTDELAVYYVGISHATPHDAEFELRCIRSFSLDRPRAHLDTEPAASHAERLRSRALSISNAAKHPLYETTSMGYGKDCEKVKYDGRFSLNHCFTNAMADYFFSELVLSKGPDTLPRRISLQLPTDGTPVTVGRAPENDIVFGANLLFVSQRHCQFFVRPAPVTMSGDDAEEEERRGGTEGQESGPRKRPREGRHVPRLELCLVDMGSSNGTFVNGVRVEENVVISLHHRDVLIFGGMRDIAVGASLPADAVADAPEIVTWCVALNVDDTPVDYVATPPVLLCADFVEAEEKRMALELLRRMTASPPPGCRSTTAATPPPTLLKRWNEAQSGQRREEKDDKTPQTPIARKAILRNDAGGSHDGECNEAANGQEDMNASTQRCGTVAAEVFLRGGSLGSTIPLCVVLRAVRVGVREFLLSRASNAATKRGRPRGGDLQKIDNRQSHLYTLTFTETHWKWVMNGGRRRVTNAKQQSAVEYQLPWPFVERIMYCAPQCGLTVLLLPDANNLPPPLVKLCHTSAKGPMHVTWMMDPAIDENTNIKTAGSGVVSFQDFLKELTRFCARHKALEPQRMEETEFLARYAPKI